MRNTMLATMALMLGVGGVARAEARVGVQRKSYVETRNDRVIAAFWMFTTVQEFERQQNPLEGPRERDALLLPGGAPSMRAAGMGAAMMGAAVALAAHAPEKVRAVVVDGRVHFGPALFEEGGMGVGIGGKF
jgi:hypothetical protein